MSGQRNSFTKFARTLFSAFGQSGEDVLHSVETVLGDGHDLQAATSYMDDVLTQGVDLINPQKEDIEKARNVAETVVWFQKNNGFGGNVFADPGIWYGGFAVIETDLTYEEAAFRFFKVMGDISGWHPDEMDNFVEFAKQCRDVSLNNGFHFAHIEEGSKPEFFYDQEEGSRQTHERMPT